MQQKIKAKQKQWGIILIIGLLILMGSVGHLEMGGDIISGIFKGIIGVIIAGWGLVKSNQWGFFEIEEE